MTTTLRDHVTRRGTWLRLLFMFLFGMIFNVVQIVIMLTVFIQFFSTLLTGHSNRQLAGLGDSLGAYVYEIIRFLTFASEAMPFPFGAWPPATRILDKENPPPSVNDS
jgi:hypothetical protein